jgi:hypothetical protein
VCWPKEGKYRKATAAVLRLRLHRHCRRASLLPNPLLNHPLQSEVSPVLLALQAPMSPQVLSLRRAPSLPETTLMLRVPVTPAGPPAKPSTSPSPGYPEISPVLLGLQALMPPQALSPPETAPVPCAPATPAVPPAEPSTSPSPGYTLSMIWCPSCINNLMDNSNLECYTCQDQRYYRSFQYEDE